MSGAKTKAYKPYPSYKTSGASWLEKLPTHWGTERLKQHVDDVNEQTRERLPNDVYIALENVEGWTGKVTGAENEVSFDSQVKRFQVGDVLFGKLRPYLAKVNTPNKAGICVGEFLVLRCHRERLSPEFLGLLLRSKQVIDAVDASTFGAKMPRANWDFIGNMLCPVPPLDEQAAIVRYLDDADQRIRAYVSAKERLIALLEEERQAVIHQAVTRGLDPNVNLKPSGVEWLGDVPEHWEVRRLKALCTMKSGDGITTEAIEATGKFPVYGGNGLRGYTTDYTHDGSYALIGRQGALCGNVHSVQGRFWASEHAVVASLHPGNNMKWFVALLEAMNLNQYSLSAAQPGLAVERVVNLWAPVPPPQEQSRIGQHIGELTVDINDAVNRASRQNELIAEYRTRLIADVVTGKIDVTRTQARTGAPGQSPEFQPIKQK